MDVADKLDLAKFKLDVGRIQVRVDPPAEWAQILDEAWRINRDYFYDPGFHGADWPAMRRKYAAFLPDLATRNDLFRVIQWMLSELAVGHSYQAPGDSAFERETVPGGLLGADYEVADGRYRFKKVFGGLNWTPDLRSPLTEPGVDVKAGEYLLAVEGKELRFPDEPLPALRAHREPPASRSRWAPLPTARARARSRSCRSRTSGRCATATGWRATCAASTEATRGASPTCTSRTPPTPATPTSSATSSRRRTARRSSSTSATTAAARWPTTTSTSCAGRSSATGRCATAPTSRRRSPGSTGPKVMLIDETAGSGGDLLPWMFRKFGLGPLVGKRTWGGLVGILGFPVLMDGGQVTAPNLAIWTEDGFIVENEGVAPDVEVEQTPKDVIAGKDPQLEKAIEIVLAALEKAPPLTPKRPPFPLRARP